MFHPLTNSPSIIGFSLFKGNVFTIGGIITNGLNSASVADIEDSVIKKHAQNTDTQLGSGAIEVNTSTTPGETRFLLYDVDNATLEKVTVGAADSGGAGYKVLRIPN